MIRHTPDSDSTTVGSSSTAVSVVATDAFGIATVTCSMDGGTFAVDAPDSVYSATVTGLTAKSYNRIGFIAADEAGNSDSIVFFIYYDPTMLDHTPPAITLKNPGRDSAIISSSSTAVSAIVTDASGIASVTCSMGSGAFEVSGADSVYSATVTGLSAGSCNNVKFIAIDASSSNNRDSIVFCIRHDPTIEDNTAPLIRYLSGPASDSISPSAAFTLVYEVKDDNNVDSVWWTLNGTAKGKVDAGTNDSYTFTGALTAPPHANRIVIYAVDKSSGRNQGSIEIILNYNTPPSEVTSTAPTNNATGIAPLTVFTWTGGDDSDGDTVYYRVIYGTGETSLNAKTPEVKTKTVTIPSGDDLEAYTKYYWQVIAYTKVYPDTVRSNVRSFTTAGVAPVITDSPDDAIINEGSALTLTVTATGTPTPTYQWYKNGTLITNETGTSYSKAAVTGADSGNYYVTVSNGVGNARQSDTAKITVRLKPVMTGQPEDKTVTEGETATFTVEATGTLPLSYQWQRNESNISGKTTATFSITAAADNNNDRFRCIITNAAGNVTSNEAVLTVNLIAPTITSSPQNATVFLGSSATLTVAATGTNLTYEWQKDGSPITGETAATFTITVTKLSDNGVYRCKVSNSGGDRLSGEATLTVKPRGMKLIPKGEFDMGEEIPAAGIYDSVHHVTLTYAFWMDTTEVTQKQYDSLMSVTYPNYVKPEWRDAVGLGVNYPAYSINWFDAALFCNARTKAINSNDTIYKSGPTGIAGSPPGPIGALLLPFLSGILF
ncbi:MAG: immunoglobulin domain-containing protein, partial [Chitinispirillaceae bacterium]|nr:immunoglobulin domain-containing protein [Chitinispirillaceae bacterium]